MIAIGISTQSRARIFLECLEAVTRLTPEDCVIAVCDDASTDDTPIQFQKWLDREGDKRVSFTRNAKVEGIAATKNVLINKLLAEPGVSDIFLVEDDVIPQTANWHEIFLKTAWEHHAAHLLYMPTKTKYGTTFSRDDGEWPIAWKQYCSGMVMYFRRSLLELEAVRGFNCIFGRYGYDHNELTARCLLAQRANPGIYPHCERAETDKAVLSKDVIGELMHQSVPSSTSQMDKVKFARANEQNYQKLMAVYRAKYIQEFQNLPTQDRHYFREKTFFND